MKQFIATTFTSWVMIPDYKVSTLVLAAIIHSYIAFHNYKTTSNEKQT